MEIELKAGLQFIVWELEQRQDKNHYYEVIVHVLLKGA